MEYLLQGVNVSGEICPMSSGSCSGINCECNGKCVVQICDTNCQGRCTANCISLFICGAGQTGHGGS